MNRYALPKLLLLGVVALAAEITVLSQGTFSGARLELLAVLAVYAALYSRDRRQAALACWSLGLIKDLGSAGPMGLYALLFLGAGASIFRFRQVLFRDHPLTQAGVSFAAAALLVLADAAVSAWCAGRLPAGRIASRTLAAALYASAATPVVFALLARPRWILR